MISKAASTNYFVAKKKKDIWGWTRVVTDVSEAGFQTCLAVPLCVSAWPPVCEFLTLFSNSVSARYVRVNNLRMHEWVELNS